MDSSITAFCANCQADTTQTLALDQAQEIVLTCTTEGCGRFIKFPAGTDPATLGTLLVAHKDANLGQVSQASLDAQAAELAQQGQQDEDQDEGQGDGGGI